MQKITISRLKNNLSAEIKRLRKNGGLEILQRDVPVARLLPIEKDRTLSYCQIGTEPFRFLEPVVHVDFDPIADLLAERRKERS
jgi:antitoxin (DNA-binding transcriptional repressor) of toxin-antitoxin stability system